MGRPRRTSKTADKAANHGRPPSMAQTGAGGESVLLDRERTQQDIAQGPVGGGLLDWRLYRDAAWACAGVAILAVPLALDPVNVPLDPSVSPKVLTLRLVEGIWAFCLVMAWGAGGNFCWRGLARHPLGAAVLFTVMAECLSVVGSGRIFWTLAQHGHLLALPVLVAATAALPRPRPALPVAVALAGSTAGGLCAVYGLLVLAGRDPLRTVYPFVYGQGDGRNFMHSFLGNPEYFGTYACALAAGGLGCAVLARRPLVRAGAATFAAMMVLCVVLSGTRGALLVFAALAMATLATRWDRIATATRRIWLASVAGAGAAGMALVLLYSTENPLNPRGLRLAQRFLELADPSSASVRERIVLYGVAGEIAGQNPVLGSGPGSFGLEFFPALEAIDARDESGVVGRVLGELNGRVAENAHSDWLQAWSDGGVVGGLAFALLGGAAFAAAWAAMRRGAGAALGGMDLAMAAGAFTAVGLYGASLFSFPLHMPARGSLFWVAVLLATGGRPAIRSR